MEPRAALALAVASAAAAVGIVAADTVYGLAVRIDAEDAGEWTTVWIDASRSRDFDRATPYPYGENCAARHFRVVADNDKPIPERLDVKVTYWNNATKRTTTLVEERLALGAFESKPLEFTVPEDAGVGAGYVPQKDFRAPVYATVAFDGGWAGGGTEAQVCVAMEGAP